MLRKISIFILILTGFFIAGCGGDLTNGDIESEFTVKGLLYHDPNTNTSSAYAFVLEEGDPIPTLTNYLVTSSQDSTQLNPIGGGAYLTSQGTLEIAPDSSYIFWTGDDFGDFYFSKTLDIADTFRVVVTFPNSRIYSGGNVSIQWNPPSQDFGYFVTIDPPSDAAEPYWEFVNSTSDHVIGADAFTTTDGDRVEGIYYIYVVAYSETFYADAVISNDNPVFFPYPDTGFTDNINMIDIKGRFGTALVSYYDSVEVIANP